MARRYVFADECGNFDFSRNRGASKYFILTTVTTDNVGVGNALLALRRDLAWRGIGLNAEFHATTDQQVVRDGVFALLAAHDFRVDSTIFEKSKAKPEVRRTDDQFYKLALYLHMKHVAPAVAQPSDELFVVGASLGTKKRRSLFHAAINDVVRQVAATTAHKAACWDCTSDPCLQVADYCAWVIQRKWESGDPRSHVANDTSPSSNTGMRS